MKRKSYIAGENSASDAARIVLHALADFQSRGLVLAERELPLDRLRGALRRAAEALELPELTDEQAAATLGALGAMVRRVPSFVAKHPFRITVPTALATQARALAAAQSSVESVAK